MLPQISFALKFDTWNELRSRESCTCNSHMSWPVGCALKLALAYLMKKSPAAWQTKQKFKMILTFTEPCKELKRGLFYKTQQSWKSAFCILSLFVSIFILATPISLFTHHSINLSVIYCFSTYHFSIYLSIYWFFYHFYFFLSIYLSTIYLNCS